MSWRAPVAMAGQPSAPPLTPSTDLGAVLEQGMRLRVCDARQLLRYAQSLQAALAAQAGELGLRRVATLFEAWGEVAHGRADAARAALRKAEALADDAASGSAANDVEAAAAIIGCDMRRAPGTLAECLQVCETWLAMPAGALSPWVCVVLRMQRVSLLESLLRLDDALRAHYEQVAAARELGAPEAVAGALGALGGLQGSVLNLHDALPLCEEAWALCAESDWVAVQQIAGINLMSVRSMLGRHGDALALMDQLQPMEARFPARQRARRLALFASVLARAERPDAAQPLLDQIRMEYADGELPRDEWLWTQAMVFNQQGRPDAALGLLQPHLQDVATQQSDSRMPYDRAQLHTQAAIACEALGDHRSALAHERAAAKARDEAAEQAMHVRRLTLQIDHDLDAARRLRDEAMRERQRALTEQQRLGELNARLEAASAAKTRFLAAASHDLRQPVQALSMYMAALAHERSASGRRELVQRMGQSLQALGGLFDVLLDVSRLDAGLVPVHRAPIRLAELLERLADELQRPARSRGLQLRLHLAPGSARATTLSDPALLEGILRNLLDNALKYTERGGVVLRLRPGSAAGTWRVEVRDTGIGIAPAQQQQVFEEFFQVGNDERDRRKGLGLGLSIVLRTATLLGHALSLRSRPAHGSCFAIELPLQAPAAVAPRSARRDAGQAQTLVVIDDDAAVRDSLQALLTRWGHRVLAEADAPALLVLWHQQGRPALDAAIIDLRLRGGRSGLQALADLRAALGAAPPALVLTGDTAPERLRLLTEAHQAWLPKPVMPMRLRAWLRGIQPDVAVPVAAAADQ